MKKRVLFLLGPFFVFSPIYEKRGGGKGKIGVEGDNYFRCHSLALHPLKQLKTGNQKIEWQENPSYLPFFLFSPAAHHIIWLESQETVTGYGSSLPSEKFKSMWVVC